MRPIRRQLTIILCTAPFCAEAASRAPSRMGSRSYSSGQSSSSSSRSTIFVHGTGGYAYLGGRGIESMNSSIFSSPLLEVEGSFGSSSIYGGGITIFDELANRCFMMTGSSMAESSSASSHGMKLDATFRMTEFGVLGGVRMWPFQKAGFNFNLATKVRPKFSDRLMLLGYAGLEYLYISHEYARKVPSSSTEIEYSYKASHFAERAGIRLYGILFSKLQLFLDASYMISQRIAVNSEVSKFTVSQQNLRYRSAELGVDEMAAAPIQAMRMDVGVSVSF
jgi:hypothetical protein